MDLLNRALTSSFDVLLWPLDRLGPAVSMVGASAVFGVLALWLFKHMSWQRGIRAAKDRIKAHVIEIRIYQDDLAVVGGAFARVMARNVQYLGLNLLPFVPLAIPFALLAGQLFVRYAYAPLPVTAAEASLLPGQGTLVEVRMAPGREREVSQLRLELPPGVRALSPLVRAPSEGRAFQEVAALQPGVHALVLQLGERAETRETMPLIAGVERPRLVQPRRVSSRDWYRADDPALFPALWPAQPTFPAGSPYRMVAVAYPERDLGRLPRGEVGILVVVVLASMAAGLLALKPLGVQI